MWFIMVDVVDIFFGYFKGVIDFEEKCKIIGCEFICVFEKV